jgi:hypothetical protein
MDTTLHPRNFVDKKLRIRLGLFAMIALIILGFIVYDIFTGVLAWWIALLALAFGLAIGYLLGRSMKAKWHESEEKIVLSMDRLAVLALVAYIALALARNWLLGHWLSGPTLSATTLAVLSGALFGRFLGMLRSIQKHLYAP